MSTSLWSRLWPPLLVFAGFLLVWQLLCTALAVPPYLVPTPTRIVSAAATNASALATGTALSYHHPFLLHPYVTAVQAALGEEPWTSRAIPLAFSLAAILALAQLKSDRSDKAGARTEYEKALPLQKIAADVEQAEVIE